VDPDLPARNVAVCDLLEHTLGSSPWRTLLVGRVAYFVGYIYGPEKRFPGFFIQSLAASVLLLGALGRIGYLAL
jgi:hypothetical protein